jgi:hypothetical protein
MAQIQIRNGESCLFWKDKWRDQSLINNYPELVSFAKNKNISVAIALAQDDMTQLLHLPVSEVAYAQLKNLIQNADQIQLNTEQDIWKYSWGNTFSSSRAYRIIVGQSQHHPSIRWIWDCFCQPKHRVFFWLLLKDRLSTRNILRRKNMFLQTYTCVLCAHNIEETVHHLFLHCEFAKQC